MMISSILQEAIHGPKGRYRIGLSSGVAFTFSRAEEANTEWLRLKSAAEWLKLGADEDDVDVRVSEIEYVYRVV